LWNDFLNCSLPNPEKWNHLQGSLHFSVATCMCSS
jgi:hypothetical protein